jgi:hydrogenase maturation protease
LLGVAARCLPGDAFTLLDAWSGHPKVIIVDAIVTAAAAPGTIHRFEIHGGAGAEQFEARLGSSTHGFGIATAFRLGQITNNVPEEAIVYGIEALNFEWGAGLSTEVHAAVQRLATALAHEAADGPDSSAPEKLAAGQ